MTKAKLFTIERRCRVCHESKSVRAFNDKGKTCRQCIARKAPPPVVAKGPSAAEVAALARADEYIDQVREAAGLPPRSA